MPGADWMGVKLAAMVASGEVSKAKVDDSAVRILWPFFAVGLFDKNNTNVQHNVTSSEHLELARDISAQATVLLQNVRVLSVVQPSFLSPLSHACI